jgi:hypothetical protein
MNAGALACLIIDDPLLRPRYGCLDYKRLLDEMKAHNFFTEIAFIPWNYKRSDARTVRLFTDNPDHFAICVHGCNHTENEFGGGNYQELCDLAATSLWRMEEHKRLAGLHYDPVMVFPQGHFSSTAMKALKDQGYYAAFNSTIRSVDGEEPPVTEYQKPATLVYHDFPLFLRRYPKDKSYFSRDLALGRPIVIVEHHGAFRNGYKSITELVDWINTLGNIRWTSLLNIAQHYLANTSVNNIQNIVPTPAHSHFNAKASFRRFLSEARDNYVETSVILTKLYKILRG